ncbi:hypothetical protein Tsubulata_013493 [Turnera subulata]|uniref:V-SNARE coiled-coil homology domain-containing protein n=1 Tax=Turnera subulata TaxID=218843 RepID=A0A9Q0FVU1_9ROSI|nr:hypothetical protein Tsubulata_013493 [Turnera subulata]
MLAAKKLLQKAVHHHHPQVNVEDGGLTPADLDVKVDVHYGVPSTASLLAFDSVQRLLAIATLDGRIKVIGGDGIEGLFISPKQLPYKYIEFLQNRGFLVGILNDNEIQVWNLESRCLACSLQWESNITAFSVIAGSCFIYIGDECGSVSVLKYDLEDAKLLHLPYHISGSSLSAAAGFPSPDGQPVVGVLPQPCSSGNRQDEISYICSCFFSVIVVCINILCYFLRHVFDILKLCFSFRVLIAYEYGLIILWDVSEARVHFVGGGKDLHLKDDIVDSREGADVNSPDNVSDHVLDKEISALCWASPNGSIVAVGYIDGDILFWKTSTTSSHRGHQNELSSSNVVRLQLSSAERRLPVIVLHWSPSDKPSNDGDGRLFIYGGDEIGSEEVLTVLTIEWSSKLETLRCTGRLDLTLTGSFADMILLPSAGATGVNHRAALSVLTNPGQLHLYDGSSLLASSSQRETKSVVHAIEFPPTVATANPPMTAAKLITFPSGSNSSKILSKISSSENQCSVPFLAANTKWPLTGGVPNQLSEHSVVERLYIAGYQDGSIRLWNATYPVLSLICIIEGEVQGVNVAGFTSPVSVLDVCFHTLNMAIGNEHGLVRIYNLNGSMESASFDFVTETEREVHTLPQVKVPHCRVGFSLLTSPILALQFTNSGAKLAVGLECGHIAVLDMNSLSILYIKDLASGSSSPVISLTSIEYANTNSVQEPGHSETNNLIKREEEIMLFLTRNATISILDGVTGSMINSHAWQPKKKLKAISMHVIDGTTSRFGLTEGKQLKEAGKDVAVNINPVVKPTTTETGSHNNESVPASGIAFTGERLVDSFILLCCEDSLRLYPTKNVIQGNNKTIRKVKHARPCCWSTPFRRDEKVWGVMLLFQTGDIEIRSFPGLELVKEISLMSILRWNFKANMEKMMSSDNRMITLVNGCELAFISLLSSENCFRIPESLPSLHDKVVAAAADAALSLASNQMKKQDVKPGLLGGIVKGLKGGKANHTMNTSPRPDFTHLEDIFSRAPFSHPSPSAADCQEVVELDIDDIEIDDPPMRSFTSSQEVKDLKQDKRTEREQLLGATDDMKPRMRTPEEIMAAYRKSGDASSVAAHARNKLVERQDKLERISQRTAELQSGAEDFASLADELVKVMEKRKWWQI